MEFLLPNRQPGRFRGVFAVISEATRLQRFAGRFHGCNGTAHTIFATLWPPRRQIPSEKAGFNPTDIVPSPTDIGATSGLGFTSW